MIEYAPHVRASCPTCPLSHSLSSYFPIITHLLSSHDKFNPYQSSSLVGPNVLKIYFLCSLLLGPYEAHFPCDSHVNMALLNPKLVFDVEVSSLVNPTFVVKLYYEKTVIPLVIDPLIWFLLSCIVQSIIMDDRVIIVYPPSSPPMDLFHLR